MNSCLFRDFLKMRNNLNDKEYLLYTIAYNIAPTIMKIKPATLINFSRDRRDSYNTWEKNKEFICSFLKINAYELKKTSNNIYVLFYNFSQLKDILNNKSIKAFLSKLDYETDKDIGNTLDTLKRKFNEGCPDEIGIFLGIPLKDVEDYINNSGENYKLISYWKVYNDVKRAKLIFSLYERSKDVVIKSILRKIK